MADDLVKIGTYFDVGTTPNVMGAKPVLRGRKKKPRYPSKTKAREVLIDFVDLNSHKLQQWLEEIYATEGPRAAFGCFVALADYCVPKLQRREITGADEGPVELKVSWTDGE